MLPTTPTNPRARTSSPAGADVTGFDLAPAMVARARTDYPDLRFEVGDLTRLLRPPRAPGWSAIVAFYALIHLAGSELPGAVASLARTLDAGYAVLDNGRLREALDLPEDRVTVERARVGEADLRALRARAPRVVDCRGARPRPGGHRVPRQTAYGVVLAAEDAAPALGGADALFMDWSDDASDPGDPADAALGRTFLYAVPLPGGRTLLEETCLAGQPAPEPDALAARLNRALIEEIWRKRR